MPLFWSGNYRKLTRSGITYIVQKYAAAAQAISTDIPATISPHVFRHTKAMHLVQANVNTIYIKDYLGHADISTTEVYARADNEAKRAHWKKPLYVWNYLALRIGSRTLILLHGFHPLAERNILCTVEQRKNSFSPLFLGGAIHI